MTGPVEKLIARGLFRDSPEIHDCNCFAQLLYNRKIMGDQQVGNAEFLLQVP